MTQWRAVDGAMAFSLTSGFKITVDYSRSIADMIAAGKYAESNPKILAYAQLLRTSIPFGFVLGAEFYPELAHFGRLISSEEAILELKKESFRPATLFELLAFGEQHPEEQRKFPIVALDLDSQHWHGFWGMPYLWEITSGRYLGLDGLDDDWDERHRFLVVRESDLSADMQSVWQQTNPSISEFARWSIG